MQISLGEVKVAARLRSFPGAPGENAFPCSLWLLADSTTLLL